MKPASVRTSVPTRRPEGSARLAGKLGHGFARPELLEQALTHRSSGAHHNERLEFVGDSVLNCVIAAHLYTRYPSLPEGELSRVRARLVNRETLARLGRGLDVGAALRIGDGEARSGGADRESIIADTLEAMFGAVFEDAGFDAARRVIEHVYVNELTTLEPETLRKDPKTGLQEWLQGRRLPLPEYAVVAVSGEAHAQTFTVECRVVSLGVVGVGIGTSRRAAEQAAAAHAHDLASSVRVERQPDE